MSIAWNHSESEPATIGPAALAAAEDGSWSQKDEKTRNRYLRTLLILTLQAGMMSNVPPRRRPEWPAEYVKFAPDQYRDEATMNIAATILRSHQLFLQRGAYEVHSVKTEDGDDPIILDSDALTETSFPILPWYVWVIGGASATAGAVMLIQKGAELVDRHLSRSQETKRLLSAHSKAVSTVLNHLDEEAKAGKPIEWSEEEKKVVNELLETQKQIAAKEERPLPSPFEGANKAIENVGESVSKGIDEGFDLVVPALILAGGLLLLD